MADRKSVAIVQSNYVPWKGYFDLIRRVDEFILLDDVQFTRRDWRNRNKIKTAQGPQWLTVPVEVKGKYNQLINETRIADPGWAAKHWRAIELNYGRARYFADYSGHFEPLYRQGDWDLLSDLNEALILAINGALGIGTNIRCSSDYVLVDGKSERLLELCLQAGATTYMSGPAARDYLDEALFRRSGVSVEWMDYSRYPPYDQLFPPFVHEVSVLDLIFNAGPRAIELMNHGHVASGNASAEGGSGDSATGDSR